MMRLHSLLPALLLTPTLALAQAAPKAPEWKALETLAGSWEGTGTGRWGDSTVTMTYERVLDGYFLLGRLHSVYPPQQKNPSGEVHGNWDVYGFDRDRNRWVMRQFHNEGFVITYAIDHEASSDKALVFVSEQIENVATLLGNGWRARQTLRFVGTDEYVELFELAGPGQPFSPAVETRFTRRAR